MLAVFLFTKGFEMTEAIFFCVMISFSSLLFYFSYSRWKTVRPFRITKDEILFGQVPSEHFRLDEIERMGWLNSRHGGRGFLIIQRKGANYIIGKRPCKHVIQSINDVEPVGEILFKLTKKPIDEKEETIRWAFRMKTIFDREDPPGPEKPR